MKTRTVLLALILAAAFVLVPSEVSAVITDDAAMGSMHVGDNHVTWDANFVTSGYRPGDQVTIKVDWRGTGRVSGLVSMGLGDKKFTPAGAQGRIIGIERLNGNSALVTMEFLAFPRQGVANAHLKMNLAVDDGTGRFHMTSFPIKCHVKEAK